MLNQFLSKLLIDKLSFENFEKSTKNDLLQRLEKIFKKTKMKKQIAFMGCDPLLMNCRTGTKHDGVSIIMQQF